MRSRTLSDLKLSGRFESISGQCRRQTNSICCFTTCRSMSDTGLERSPWTLATTQWPRQRRNPLSGASHGHGNGAVATVAGSNHGSPGNSTTPMLRPEDAGRTLNPVHLHRLTGGSGGLSAELKPTSVVSVSEAELPKRHNSETRLLYGLHGAQKSVTFCR